MFFIAFLLIILLLFWWVNDRSSAWCYITTGNWYFLIVDLFWTRLYWFHIFNVLLLALVKWTFHWVHITFTYRYLIIVFFYFLWRAVVDYFFPRLLKINWDHRCTLTLFGLGLTERSSGFWLFLTIFDYTRRPSWIGWVSYKFSRISSSDSHYKQNNISKQIKFNHSHYCTAACSFIFLFSWTCLCRDQHVVVVWSAWIAHW